MVNVSDLRRLIVLSVAGVVGVLGFGKFSLLGPVKTVDEAVLDAAVPWLQSVPGLTSFSEVGTDLGAIPINFFMLLVLAAAAVLRYRHIVPAALVLMVGFGAHALQNVTNRIVEGTVPTRDVIGAAGPYFSGGVMRVILLAGLALTFLLPERQQRLVWSGAALFGLFEAVTRLTLGRHWPIDLVSSFPIGLGLLYLFRQTLSIAGAALGFKPGLTPTNATTPNVLADQATGASAPADRTTARGR